MPETILIVEDDILVRRSLVFHRQKADFQVLTAGSAETALDMAWVSPPDLVLSDMSLPVIFLSVRRSEIDEIVGLELEANDYITRPFDKDVLLAPVRATLRQACPAINRPEALEEIELIY